LDEKMMSPVSEEIVGTASRSNPAGLVLSNTNTPEYTIVLPAEDEGEVAVAVDCDVGSGALAVICVVVVGAVGETFELGGPATVMD
jgi:hypothetical protein